MSTDLTNISISNGTDYYDYDMEDSLAINWVELGPNLVMYAITFILGIIGNCLILVAVIRQTYVKSSPVNVFLASLASADLLLILVCLPLKVSMHRGAGTGRGGTGGPQAPPKFQKVNASEDTGPPKFSRSISSGPLKDF